MTDGQNGWPGCHGARLIGPASIDVGTCEGQPLADVRVTVAEPGSLRSIGAGGAGSELWRLEAAVETRSGVVMAHQRLVRLPDGHLMLRTNRGAVMRVGCDPDELSIESPDPGTGAQLVASFGIPLVLSTRDVLFLHGSACARGGRALAVVGASGSGKSSLLVRMVQNGWSAISEDVCALDLRDDPPCAWPGPPWVRCLRNDPGPIGSSPRFETEDKVVWDTSRWQTRSPTPLHVIVVLERGSELPARREILSRGASLAAVAEHSVWLGAIEDRSRALFDPVARVSGAVKVFRVSSQRSRSWLDEVSGILEGLMS